jgi:hypothetical protein
VAPLVKPNNKLQSEAAVNPKLRDALYSLETALKHGWEPMHSIVSQFLKHKIAFTNPVWIFGLKFNNKIKYSIE